MLIRNVTSILILMGLLSLATMLAHASDTDKQAQTLEFSLGQTASRASTNILDVGPVEKNTSAQLKIVVRNVTSKSITLDSFAIGNNLSSEWESPQIATGLKTRTSIEGNGAKRLIMAVQFANPSPARVEFMVQGRHIATLFVVYQIMVPKYCSGVQDVFLPSAYGSGYYPDESHPYTFCTASALPGYELDPNSIIFTVRTNKVSSHGRGCDGTGQGINSYPFTDCRKISNEKGDVCFTLRIQGHHTDGGLGKSTENQTIYVDARLKADYRLILPTNSTRSWPRLLSSDQFDTMQKASPVASESSDAISLSPNCQWNPNIF
jgi:hypothetical protein